MIDKPPTKDKVREQLDIDVQTFPRKGGKITQHSPAETAGNQVRYVAGNVAWNRNKENGRT